MTKCVIRTQAQNAATAHSISVSQNRKQYRLYNDEVFFKSLLTFFLQNGNEPLQAFCKKENMNRSTFRCFFVESGLQNLKKNGIHDEEQAKKLLHAYFESKMKNRSSHTKNASNATRYLSENEELSIIQMCRLLGSMGYGITRDELQSFISTITNWQDDE